MAGAADSRAAVFRWGFGAAGARTRPCCRDDEVGGGHMCGHIGSHSRACRSAEPIRGGALPAASSPRGAEVVELAAGEQAVAHLPFGFCLAPSTPSDLIAGIRPLFVLGLATGARYLRRRCASRQEQSRAGSAASTDASGASREVDRLLIPYFTRAAS